jgi:hypothetical protein
MSAKTVRTRRFSAGTGVTGRPGNLLADYTSLPLITGGARNVSRARWSAISSSNGNEREYSRREPSCSGRALRRRHGRDGPRPWNLPADLRPVIKGLHGECRRKRYAGNPHTTILTACRRPPQRSSCDLLGSLLRTGFRGERRRPWRRGSSEPYSHPTVEWKWRVDYGRDGSEGPAPHREGRTFTMGRGLPRTTRGTRTFKPEGIFPLSRQRPPPYSYAPLSGRRLPSA